MRVKNSYKALVLGIIAAAAFVSPSRSEAANTAANTLIRNTVTVNYNDANGAAMGAQTAYVVFKVALKAATPNVALVGSSTQTTDNNTAVDYHYTFTTAANGPDSYPISLAALTQSANISGSTAKFYYQTGAGGSEITSAGQATSINLGATTAAAGTTIAAGATQDVTVLRDQQDIVAYNGTVNGIANGARVIINGNAFLVNSVIVVTGEGTTTINVTSQAAGATTINLGDQILEQKDIYMHVVPGTISGGGANTTISSQTIGTSFTARDHAGDQVATGAFTTTTTVLVPHLTVVKYVRNTGSAGNPTGGTNGDTQIPAGTGPHYFASGVTGKPGDTLEYVVSVTNDSGRGTATNVVISDPLTSYTALINTSLALDPDGTGFVAKTAAADGDAAEVSGGSVIFYAGTGGKDSGGGVGSPAGGSLSTGVTTYAKYQVTIN